MRIAREVIMHSRYRTSTLAAMALLALWLAPGAAGADAHEHDGFFLRLATGIGGATDSVTDDDGVVNTIRGAASTSSIAIGYTITENLALHAEIFHAALIEPESTKGGSQTSAVVLAGKYFAAGFGAGVTYYFTPSNFYISGAVGGVVLNADFGIARFSTEPGFGMDFLFGKEWWVSDNWAIGVAGQFIFARVPSQYSDSHNTISGALLFSASYN